MPNWCQNRLIIRCPTEDHIDIIKTTMLGGYDDDDKWVDVTFKTLIPEPDFEDEDLIKQMGLLEEHMYGKGGVMPTWWTWRCEYWGTKWDACEPSLEVVDSDAAGCIIYVSFDTAWSPPMPWMWELRTKLKELGLPQDALEFSFIEHGNGFCGIYRDGVLTENEVTEEQNEEFEQDYGTQAYF